MGRTRVNFPVQAAYIGPLATGFHFYDPVSLGLNNTFTLASNYNLIQQLDRVFNASYEISTTPAALKQLGTKGLLSRPLLEPPLVSLNFEYYINGIKNEARLGFDVNYAQFQGTHKGDSYYASRVCPISGFSSRELVRITSNPFWSHTCKDFRNLFFAVGLEGKEIRETIQNSAQNESDLSYRLYDTGSRNYEILAFGNCYINNYSLSAAVGEIPRANVSYLCENLTYSTTGGLIPAVNKKDFSQTDKFFLIPKTVYESGIAALAPGDITVSLLGEQRIYNIGVDYSDAKVQSFNIDLPIPRENLNSLGYVLPLDRPITPPIYSTLKIDLIMGNGTKSGSISDLFTGFAPYNFQIQMLGSTGCAFPKFSSFLIDVSGALLRTASFNSTTESNKTCNLVFDVEIDSSDLSKGMFWSGRTNIGNMNALPTF